MPTFVDQTKIEVQAGKGGDGMADQLAATVVAAAALFLLLTAVYVH